MTIIVVNEAEGEVVVFGGEAEGVFGEEVEVGDAGGAGSTGDGAEGGVVVVGGDAVLEGVVEDLGDVLVAVVGVEEIEVPILGTHDERTRSDRLGGIPHKLCTDGVAVGGIQPLDTEKVVVDEAEVRGDLISTCLLVVHATAHAVESHGDYGVSLRPTDGAILGIVDDRPNARLGFDESLVSVRVVLGREVIDGDVLVEVVGGVGFAFGGRAVSDVVVVVGDLIRGGQLIAGVAAVLLLIDKNTATTKEGRSPL